MADDNIRAVLMEGSRVFETVDQYSDYDIVYATVSSEPYFDGAILPLIRSLFCAGCHWQKLLSEEKPCMLWRF